MVKIDFEVWRFAAYLHYYSRDHYDKLSNILLVGVQVHLWKWLYLGFSLRPTGYMLHRPAPIAFEASFLVWHWHKILPRWLGGPKRVDYPDAA